MNNLIKSKKINILIIISYGLILGLFLMLYSLKITNYDSTKILFLLFFSFWTTTPYIFAGILAKKIKHHYIISISTLILFIFNSIIMYTVLFKPDSSTAVIALLFTPLYGVVYTVIIFGIYYISLFVYNKLNFIFNNN
jgi:hypothetical protein